MSPETEISTKRSKPRISLLLATWFGLGYLPKAPGTWGSLGGVGVWFWVLDFVSPQLLHLEHGARRLFLDDGLVTGTPRHRDRCSDIGDRRIVATRAARYAQIEDPQWVVIDEVSGQLITYYFFFWVLPLNWKSWLLGFILFRIFDIWKPFPARQLERLPGGWGIMADDWMAGIYAAIVLRVALHFRVL